jgi:hypothetical protein
MPKEIFEDYAESAKKVEKKEKGPCEYQYGIQLNAFN